MQYKPCILKLLQKCIKINAGIYHIHELENMYVLLKLSYGFN